MRRTLQALSTAFILAITVQSQAEEAPKDNSGLIRLKSYHSVEKTAERLEAALTSKGMTIFARIDHAAGAESVNEKLRPTEVVIFGNPKIGTKLMQCEQSTAIDLPHKALIWEDKAGEVWYAYNKPSWLKKRHDIDGCKAVISKIEHALAGFANAATKAE